MGKVFGLMAKAADVLMALCLAGMAVLVFLNVVLRYAFHSGIAWSEEMSRIFFVWLTFLGAIGALKDNQHLGVDMFVRNLPLLAKRIVFLISNLIILYVLWLVFDGSWKTTLVSTNALSPATGLPMSYIYGIGILMSVGMAFIVLVNLYRVLFQKEFVPYEAVKGSEEELLHAGQGECEAQQKQVTAGGNGSCR